MGSVASLSDGTDAWLLPATPERDHFPANFPECEQLPRCRRCCDRLAAQGAATFSEHSQSDMINRRAAFVGGMAALATPAFSAAPALRANGTSLRDLAAAK